MTNQHQATPDDWAQQEDWANRSAFSDSSCIIELRDRVEALEVGQQPPQDKLDRLIALDRDDPAATNLAARPLLEKVARMADCIDQRTVSEIIAISNQAEAWLNGNPPGQPVAIEPRGCPTPGACSCVEPAAQPEPVAPTDEELGRRFRAWWHDEGSGLPPLPGMDHEEHVRRISEIAWANGAYVARYGTPANALPTPEATNV